MTSFVKPRTSDTVVVVIAAMAEGIALGTIFGGLWNSLTLAAEPGFLIAPGSALISACTSLIAVALLPVRSRDTRLVLALVVGVVFAYSVAYVLQPLGGPV